MYQTSLEEKTALLGSYLERHLDGFRGPLQLEKFDQGQSNPTFLITAHSGNYVSLYCRLRGIGTIENWPFYLAFSYFRLGAICQGVFQRALDGNASDGRAIMRGNLTPRLAAMAVELLNEESVL